MRYAIEGYSEESRTGERYLREKEHNEWHDIFEVELERELSPRVVDLLHVFFSDSLHEYNIPPDDADQYR